MTPDTSSDDDERLAVVGTNEVRSDWERAPPPSLAVVEAVAAATSREPTELPPLADDLDTDALDNLLTRAASEADSTTRVSFTYAGCRVDLDSTGRVAVEHDAASAAGEPGTSRSTSAFNASLKRLLADAHGNGVPVEGGWVCRNGAEMPDYDVEITEVTKSDGDAPERG